MSENQTNSELMNARQVASFFGVCRHTVRAWTAAGKLPCVRITARVIRFRREDVDRLAAASVAQSEIRPNP